MDRSLLMATRVVRMGAYGLLSVVLALYLARLGFSEAAIGLLMTLTLVGDTAISLWLATSADAWGRRRTLAVGAGLMIAAGVVFAFSSDWSVLLVAATVGVISPGGNEVGPFLSVEQAALAQVIEGPRRTTALAWYNLAGSLATAGGALAGGLVVQAMRSAGYGDLAAYRAVVIAYAALGAALVALFGLLSAHVEAPRAAPSAEAARVLGLGPSRGRVMGLAGLFSLDAFGGGFVVQSLVALYFHRRWGLEEAWLGAVFFAANALAGLSGLVAAQVARRIGLLNTMVFTHLPSNVLLMLVPLMPTAEWAVAMLLARFAISQMDVPTRQALVLAMVRPEERSAAAGVTGVARTLGAAASPALAGRLLGSPALMGAPFLIGGGVKIVYDLAIWWSFRKATTDEHR